MAVNWQKWRFIPKCKLWQAVCLTLDIDPDSKDPVGLDDWWRNDRCRGVPYGFTAEYTERLNVVMANVSTNGPIHPLALYVGVLNNPYAEVNTTEVYAAAAAWGWVVPDAINNPPTVGFVTAPAQTPAPVAETKPDVTLMATRQQLIDAFGSFTGMKLDWFYNAKDTPALFAARKVTGQGGRGHIEEPLFCPFEVLQWLINPARRKGRPLGPGKGWELFEGHFPRAYAAFSVGDPRTD